MSEEPRFPSEPQALDLSAKKLDTEESDDAKIEHISHEVVPSKGPRKVSQVLMMIWSGVALASDGYNSQSMGSANNMLELLYPESKSYTGYENDMEDRVSSAYYVGLCLGAVFFGFLIDRFSRKTGIVLATCLMIVGGALATASWGNTPHHMFWMLTVTRGILGFGAGGEYPTCSTGATEAGDESPFVRKHRGMLVSLVGCTAVDTGIVFGGIWPLITLVGYGYRSNTDPNETKGLRGAWRISLGLGLIIPLSVFFFRLRMMTSSAFQNHALRQNLSLKVWWVVIKTYWPRIIGTCLTWFLYDFINYPFTLFSSNIAEQLPGGNDSLVHQIGYSTAMNVFMIPGCLVGALVLDKLGRRNTQALGFALQAVFGFVLGGGVVPIHNITGLYVVLYGLLLATGEGGPGICTLLLSAESYPTAVRGNLAGLSAAVAKAGAAIGTHVFAAIKKKYKHDKMQSLRVPVLIAASIAVVGCILTLLCFPATHSEVLQDEDLRFRRILKEHGISDDIWANSETLQRSALAEYETKLDSEDRA